MIKKRLDRFFDSARSYKKSLSIVIDTILILLSLCLAYLIRLGSIGEIGEKYVYQIFLIALIICPLKILIFWIFRLYHISFRYISLGEVLSIIKASAISSPMIAFIALVFRDTKIFLAGFPRSVIFIDFFLTLFFITGIRVFFRLYYSDFNKKRGQETLIVGAGSAGEQLVRDMIRSTQYSHFPVGFIDDNTQKKNTLIHGIRVLGGREGIPNFVKLLNVKGIIIAIPSVTSKEIRGIMEYVRKTNLKDVKVLPGISDLIKGKVTLKDVRDISIEDLLGREPVKIDMGQVSSYIKNKNILVTGAGGSIGSELCRQIARFNPERLIMLDMGETELFNIDMEIKEKYPDLFLLSIVGDIKDEHRIKRVFRENSITIVFHAAAYKHVPLMEENQREAILNNIYGTKVLAKISSESGVEKFINISTDKAVNPTSVMGATKRVAENLILCLASNSTSFISVRFGNVLGSRGSVVPIFQEQIKKGGPITITDYEMKRYFMTIPESVQLIMQAGAIGNGNDVFVLDMGEPVSIYQVAEELIRLSGLEPDKDIPIVISGKRPGEKIFEELLTAEEGTTATIHKKIYSARITGKIDKEYLEKIDLLISLAIEDKDRGKIISLLKELVPTYKVSKP
ncbi:MAG: polysaccharide biosynthesis protein [Deltaproteobacteria bacterium]|nr:polysaccharide biosynthesis protein [Deltaproteobacteria bacterium]